MKQKTWKLKDFTITLKIFKEDSNRVYFEYNVNDILTGNDFSIPKCFNPEIFSDKTIYQFIHLLFSIPEYPEDMTEIEKEFFKPYWNERVKLYDTDFIIEELTSELSYREEN